MIQTGLIDSGYWCSIEPFPILISGMISVNFWFTLFLKKIGFLPIKKFGIFFGSKSFFVERWLLHYAFEPRFGARDPCCSVQVNTRTRKCAGTIQSGVWCGLRGGWFWVAMVSGIEHGNEIKKAKWWISGSVTNGTSRRREWGGCLQHAMSISP